MSPRKSRQLLVWGLIFSAVLSLAMLFDFGGPDSDEARTELRSRFGVSSTTMRDAYFERSWNFVGRAPEYLRFRYEDEAVLLYSLKVERSTLMPRSKLPGFHDAPKWWNAQGQALCIVRRKGSIENLNPEEEVPLFDGFAFCIEPISRVAYMFHPGH